MTIALTAFQEKLRRKDFYIVSAIGILILLLFGTGSGTLSIGGVEITDYKMLSPILLTVMNAIVCFLSVMMSLSTIPNEYERKTSHLIWARKISQSRYHGELALANIFSGLVSETILFAAIIIFMIQNGRADDLWRLIPTYLIIGINVAEVCLLTGIISMGEAKYNTEEQVSTIWHEAFHCWQFTNFEDNIDKIYSGIIDENTISQSVDANTQAAEMLADQLTILKETIKCEDVDKMRENIVKYKQLDTQRKELLTENITQLEDYYTIVEGTAFYVESCIYRSELPNKYMSVYIDDIDEYKGGAAKYYHMGMAQCMILDKLNSEWKTNYRFSESLMEMIYEELEI